MRRRTTRAMAAMGFLVLATIPAHAASLKVRFDPEGTQISPPSILQYVPIDFYLIAEGLPEIDAWRGALSIDTDVPGLLLGVVEVYDGPDSSVVYSPPHEVDFGEVRLDHCVPGSPTRVLVHATLIPTVNLPDSAEVRICPTFLGGSDTGAFRRCGSDAFENFDPVDDFTCGTIANCQPTTRLELACADARGVPSSTQLMPIDMTRTQLQGLAGCPPILICWFCGPHEATWHVTWDHDVASFASFTVDPSMAEKGHLVTYEEIPGGLSIREAPADLDFASIGTGPLGLLGLHIDDEAAIGSIPIHLEWTETIGEGPSTYIYTTRDGSLEVLDPLPVEAPSFGILKSRWK